MTRTLALVLFAVAITSGCRMCSNSCDYSSPLVRSAPVGYGAVEYGGQTEPPIPDPAVIDKPYNPPETIQDATVDSLTEQPPRPAANEPDGDWPVISTADYVNW